MDHISWKAIAVSVALLFVLAAAGVSVAVVAEGVASLRVGTSDSVAAEQKETREEKAAAKEKKAAEKAAAKEKKAAEKAAAKEKKAAEKAAAKKKKDAVRSAYQQDLLEEQKTTVTTTAATTPKKTTERTTARPSTTTAPAKGKKVIYLTFDDGPYQYTDELLRILEKYDVHATFFVTDLYPKYQDLIAKEYEQGHVVAVHSYHHEYSEIYASTSAYWKDFERMNDIIEKQTGHRTTLFRFPGGSSNTVSRHYSDGIMTRLVKQADEKGLTYFDWNVLSGDAGETIHSEQVYRNIIDGVQEQDRSIVLCHDVKGYTVDAMEKTIKWCLDHGYTFEVLAPGGFHVHHGVNN